jgi:hypothetical protein
MSSYNEAWNHEMNRRVAQMRRYLQVTEPGLSNAEVTRRGQRLRQFYTNGLPDLRPENEGLFFPTDPAFMRILARNPNAPGAAAAAPPPLTPAAAAAAAAFSAANHNRLFNENTGDGSAAAPAVASAPAALANNSNNNPTELHRSTRRRRPNKTTNPSNLVNTRNAFLANEATGTTTSINMLQQLQREKAALKARIRNQQAAWNRERKELERREKEVRNRIIASRRNR